MERKFKMRDKVVIKKLNEIDMNVVEYIGKIGVITNFNSTEHPIEVNFKDGAYVRFKREELELVQEDSFLTVEESKKALEELKQSPCKTYTKKLEDFRKTLTPEEIIEEGKFQNDMNDMRKNQTLQEVADEVNELFNDSDNQQIKKSDVMAIITDKIKLDD
jgi:hypothetical protein